MKSDFRSFLTRYIEFSEIVRKNFKGKFPQEELDYFFLKNGKVIAKTLSEKDFDITKLIMSEIEEDFFF